ncbi:MAG: hypothetical protein ACTS73_01710 [Arsenophonus sp. NEOnobi-MAG3]
MICHEKSILQVSVKLDITSDLLHELIHNSYLPHCELYRLIFWRC